MQIALCAGATLAIVLLSLFHIYEQVMELVIHYVQNSLTGSMLPVINSMLSETAGLGFIGVVVQILALKGEDTWLGALSEKLYEKPEVRESLSLGVVCPHATRHASQMSQTHTHPAHTLLPLPPCTCSPLPFSLPFLSPSHPDHVRLAPAPQLPWVRLESSPMRQL